jgi:hypothetical protein
VVIRALFGHTRPWVYLCCVNQWTRIGHLLTRICCLGRRPRLLFEHNVTTAKEKRALRSGSALPMRPNDPHSALNAWRSAPGAFSELKNYTTSQ